MKCGEYKIDLGCGTEKEKGFIGVDKSEYSNADIIHDVRKGLPFCSNSAIEIRAYSFLEHFTNDEFIDLMWEIWRVLKPDGKLNLIVPCAPGEVAFKDPTHKMFFAKPTFTYFEAGHLRQKQYNLPPFSNIVINPSEGRLYVTMKARK